MNDQELIDALGFTNANSEMQTRVVENVRTIVELRVVGVLSEMMTSQQLQEFEQLKQQNPKVVWDWLEESVAGVNVRELYKATLEDYLAERQSDPFQV